MKYPLEFLLGLRATRMERCEQALAQARALVRRREEDLAARIQDHKDYLAWCDAEENRIFDRLAASPSAHTKILEAREEMLANRAREAEFLHRIEVARTELAKAREEETARLQDLQIAIRNREKLDSHKKFWSTEQRLAEQMAEDLVMEETAESAYLRNHTATSHNSP